MYPAFEKIREHLKNLSEEDKIRIGSKLYGRMPTAFKNNSKSKKGQ